MKKLMLLVATMLTLGISSIGYAQQQSSSVPHAFKYQAVARDSKGDVLPNQNVSFRISILQGTENGTTVYEETQSATTNQFGLANLSIGSGNSVIGNFTNVAWGEGPFFVKIEFDPKGGTDYLLMGTSEMLSVPYALYSENAGNVENFPVRAALVATNVAGPISNPETGMLVYNTTSSGTAPYNVVPGYYYNAGTPLVPNWLPLSSGNSPDKVDRILVCNTYQYGTCAGSTSTAADNTGYGDASLSIATMSGTDNSALGFQALNAVTSGIDNTASGSQAMLKCNTGDYNVADGFQALENLTGGNRDIAIGYQAGQSMTTGEYNIAMGFAALQDVTTANYNTALGYGAANINTASYVTGVGALALNDNTSGTYNTALGYGSSRDNQTASSITSVGFEALYNNTASWNTAIGDSALYSNTSGIHNVGTGYGASAVNQKASGNTSDGYRALYNNKADGNTAMGDSALFNNATGLHNTATGYAALTSGASANATGNTANGFEALYSNTGSFNTAIGDSALVANTVGEYNVAVGYMSLISNVGGSGYGTENVAVGAYSLYYNTGSENVAVGMQAMQNNTTGSQNAAVGLGCLTDNTTGTYNTSMGMYASALNTDGGDNVSFGNSALYYNVHGYANTAIGTDALYNNTGGGNTSLGLDALYSNTTGGSNTAIGDGADVGTGTLTNATVIGANAIVNANNALVLGGTGSSSVKVGIGTSTPTAGLDIADGGTNSNCHIKSEGTAPSTSIPTQNGVTAVTLATNSTDTKGNISVTTGTNNGTGYTVIKISYNKAYNASTVPIVLLTPANADASKCQYYVSYNTATADFEIYFEGNGLAPSFNYFVIE